MKVSFLIKVKRFFRENPGAVLVLGFQVVLVICAVLLVLGGSFLAESIAVVAYFLLVLGVVLQLVCFVRSSDGGEVE
jgi:heme/copper-type cytochrome/quinol oxidase subunit 4